MTKKTIFFRVDGDDGTKVGLGHLNRIVKIFFNIKKKYNRKFDYVFILKEYKTGKKFLKKKIKNKLKIIPYNKLNKIIINNKDIFIIDTLGIEKKLSILLKKNKISKILSFDETNLSNLKSGIIINGIFFAKKKLKKNKKVKIYQGTKYLILDKKFSKFKQKKKQNLLNNVLVTSGGSDHKNMMYKVIKVLLKFFDLKKINAAVGFGVRKNNILFKIQNKKVRFVKNAANLSNLLSECSICICSGGTVMFESIASGNKPLVIQTYENQKYAIKYFKNKRAIVNLHTINSRNFEKKLFKTIKRKIKIKNNLPYLNKRNNLVDGKGLFRVFQIIEKFIN